MSLKPPRLHRTLLLVGALCAAASAFAANGYYRWTDDSGKVQFSQQPPDGRPYQFVRTSTGTVEDRKPAEAAAADEKKATAGSEFTSMQGLPAKDPEKCQQARDNLSVLDGSARIRAKGQDGDYRFLQPEEIAEQKKRANEAVDIFCD